MSRPRLRAGESRGGHHWAAWARATLFSGHQPSRSPAARSLASSASLASRRVRPEAPTLSRFPVNGSAGNVTRAVHGFFLLLVLIICMGLSKRSWDTFGTPQVPRRPREDYNGLGTVVACRPSTRSFVSLWAPSGKVSDPIADVAQLVEHHLAKANTDALRSAPISPELALAGLLSTGFGPIRASRHSRWRKWDTIWDTKVPSKTASGGVVGRGANAQRNRNGPRSSNSEGRQAKEAGTASNAKRSPNLSAANSAVRDRVALKREITRPSRAS